MNLWRPYTKAMLANGSLWFWAFAFMAFWLAVGAFVESAEVGPGHSAVVAYTTSWYAVIVLLSLSMLAVAIANSLTYGSSALAYAFRFSRLTPEGYFGSIVGGSAVMGAVLSFVLIGATAGMFGGRFRLLLLPADPAGLLAVSLLGGVFFMALAVTMILVVINYLGLKSTNFTGFLPLVLSITLGNAQIYLALPSWFVYGSPFNDLASLLYQGYSGVPATGQLGAASLALTWEYLVVGILVWTAVLGASSLVLLRQIRSRQLEEGRQI